MHLISASYVQRLLLYIHPAFLGENVKVDDFIIRFCIERPVYLLCVIHDDNWLTFKLTSVCVLVLPAHFCLLHSLMLSCLQCAPVHHVAVTIPTDSCPCFILQCLPQPFIRPSQSFSSCVKCWTSTTLTSSLARSRTRTGSNSPKKSKVRTGGVPAWKKRELNQINESIAC